MSLAVPSRLRVPVAILAAAVVLLVIAWFFATAGSNQSPALPTTAYFTVDDGATLFTDSITRRAPFDSGGRTAVRAHVFSVDGGKTRFVGYLERDSPDVARRRAEAVAKGAPENLDIVDPLVKKPGDANAPWFSRFQPGFNDVTNVLAPNGAAGTPQEVFP